MLTLPILNRYKYRGLLNFLVVLVNLPRQVYSTLNSLFIKGTLKVSVGARIFSAKNYLFQNFEAFETVSMMTCVLDGALANDITNA